MQKSKIFTATKIQFCEHATNFQFFAVAKCNLQTRSVYTPKIFRIFENFANIEKLNLSFSWGWHYFTFILYKRCGKKVSKKHSKKPNFDLKHSKWFS
jgi:hypothetical protein